MGNEQIVRDTYLSFDEIFNTKKARIPCPSEIKIRVVRGFIDYCIPKTTELILKKEILKDGDVIMVGSIDYPDRYYWKGNFLRLGAKTMKIKRNEKIYFKFDSSSVIYCCDKFSFKDGKIIAMHCDFEDYVVLKVEDYGANWSFKEKDLIKKGGKYVRCISKTK